MVHGSLQFLLFSPSPPPPLPPPLPMLNGFCLCMSSFCWTDGCSSLLQFLSNVHFESNPFGFHRKWSEIFFVIGTSVELALWLSEYPSAYLSEKCLSYIYNYSVYFGLLFFSSLDWSFCGVFLLLKYSTYVVKSNANCSASACSVLFELLTRLEYIFIYYEPSLFPVATTYTCMPRLIFTLISTSFDCLWHFVIFALLACLDLITNLTLSLFALFATTLCISWHQSCHSFVLISL